MTFKNIQNDTYCNCLNDCFENNDELFARKIGKSGSIPKDRDFKSYWESGKRPENLNDCNLVCKYKGISVNPWNSKTKDFIINLYSESVRIAPKHEKKICVFKLAKDGGQYRHTAEIGNENHHDLLKSDQFTIDKIIYQEMISIDV